MNYLKSLLFMKNLKFSILLTLSALIFFGVACSSSSDENQNFTDAVTDESESDSKESSNTESSEEEVELSELALQGETLFNTNCVACHMMSEEDLIGPGMKGVTERRDKEWIKKFVKNSQAVIASGDEYAVELYEKYNKTVMTSFNFTDEEFEALYAYLEANQ